MLLFKILLGYGENYWECAEILHETEGVLFIFACTYK